MFFRGNPPSRVNAADRFSSECAQYSTFSAKINDLADFRQGFGCSRAIRVKRGAFLWSVARPGVRREEFLELAGLALEILGVRRGFLLLGDIRPGFRVFGVDLEPLLKP